MLAMINEMMMKDYYYYEIMKKMTLLKFVFSMMILLLLKMEDRLVSCDDDGKKRMMMGDFLVHLFFVSFSKSMLMISNVEGVQKRNFEEKLVKIHLFLGSLMMMGFFLKVLVSTFLDHSHEYRYFHDE